MTEQEKHHLMVAHIGKFTYAMSIVRLLDVHTKVRLSIALKPLCDKE